MQQYYNAERVSILSNRDGWTVEDLENLKELVVKKKFEVTRIDTSLILKADYMIPTLMIVLGALFYPFFQSFFSELGKDAYHGLKNYIARRSKEFQENFDDVSFHKIEFLGKYEGVDIHTSLDVKDQSRVNDAFERMNEVIPLIKNLIKDFQQREKEIERIWIRYSPKRRKWELNFTNFADGSEEFGEVYHDKDGLDDFLKQYVRT